MPADLNPFINGSVIPRHWCRIDGESLYIFFPNPSSDRLKFPIEYGQSLNTEERSVDVTVEWMGKPVELHLKFSPYQSLLSGLRTAGQKQLILNTSRGRPR
ncbi:MAG: hypothetical protein R2758_13630 [Bacteroidales bacterium]